MASITRRLLFSSAKHIPRASSRQVALPYSIQWQRPLSCTAPRHDESNTTPSKLPRSADSPASSSKPKKLSHEEKVQLQEKQRTEALDRINRDLQTIELDGYAEAVKNEQQALPWNEDYKMDSEEDFEIVQETGKPGYWAEGEPSLGPDEEYYGDDLTALGHGELDQHRELREYARLIAWELPLLNQLARPFELPTAATPFRFRYTSYLGEQHPATNKVVVEFCASDMPNLTPLQKDKLIKLAGPRYNPDTDIIKMSCELFDTLPQNKRFLGDTISKLLAEARDGQDTFSDVPFDFRHHKPKVRHEFPKEWILTEERKKYLEAKRQQSLKLEDERAQNGEVLDGQKIIDTALPFTTPVAEPVMVSGPRGRQLR